MKVYTKIFLFLLVLLLMYANMCWGITESDFREKHAVLSAMAVHDRIAFWAEQFIGTPYDTDPLGEYVRRDIIVADEHVDCMYLTFRTVELAMSENYEDAVEKALNLRFRTQGELDEQGKVRNYEDRFEYGIDMIRSGKWGKDVTAGLGKTVSIRGARGIDRVTMIDKESAAHMLGELRNGDLIFFVKDPAKRKVGEIIGHIGIASVSGGGVFLIHAGGIKKRGGMVKKVRLSEYLNEMPFIGIMITRID
jgi:hypothetical protein